MTRPVSVDMAAETMKTSFYLVPAAGILAAAVTFHTQYSGRSGARELPPVPVATVPLTAEPPPLGGAGLTLPPIVTAPSVNVIPVSAPLLAIPSAPSTPVVANSLPAIPANPTTPTAAPSTPLPATALPAIPAAPAILPMMPPVTPVMPPTATQGGLNPLPSSPPVKVNPPALPVVPVVAAPAIPAAPATPVVPPAPTVAPAIPVVSPNTPVIPATPMVPVLLDPDGMPVPTTQPTPPIQVQPMPVQPQVVQPQPTPVPAAPQVLPAPTPLATETPAVPTPEKFILLKGNKLTEGNVTVAGEKAVVRQGSLERTLPRADVLFVAETKDDVYRFMLAQVPPTDVAARLGVARWCMFAGLREQALNEAKEVLKLQPTNTAAASMARSLEESLKQFPTAGSVSVVAAKPAGGVLVAVEREADVTPEGATTFSARAQPVLANQCMDCHARADYAGAFKLIRITGFEVGPQSTKSNLSATAAQLKKEDPLNSPLLTKALATHGGMKQPAFVSRQAAGFRMLEAWVALAVLPPTPPMTAPVQPVLPTPNVASVPPMTPPALPAATNPVLPAAEPVPAIPPATETFPPAPVVPPGAAIPSSAPPSEPIPTAPASEVESTWPTPVPAESAPETPLPTAPVPSVPTIPVPAIPVPSAPTSLPALPVPSAPASLPAPPVAPTVLPTPPEMVPAVPVVLPTPSSIPQVGPQPKPPASPMSPLPPMPPGVSVPKLPTPSQFGTATPPKPAKTGPAGGDEFDPANFNKQ